MARRRGIKFATDREGTHLFVWLADSGIHPMVAMRDGLPLIYFGEKDGPYLDVEAVASWHEKELKESGGRSGNKQAADDFRAAIEKFRRGEVVVRG
jgi:hypothetical protein